MVTIKDIAEECNVSITTVSNVLNGKAKVGEKTKQRILEVIEKRGYRPNAIAQGLRSQKTKNIAIIADDIAQFSTPEIIEGIMSYCEQRSYRTTVRNLRLYARWQDTWYNNDAAFHSILNPILDELNSHMVDGIIYIAGHARKINCFPENFGTPAVMAYAYDQNPMVPAVLPVLLKSRQRKESGVKPGLATMGVLVSLLSTKIWKCSPENPAVRSPA